MYIYIDEIEVYHTPIYRGGEEICKHFVRDKVFDHKIIWGLVTTQDPRLLYGVFWKRSHGDGGERDWQAHDSKDCLLEQPLDSPDYCNTVGFKGDHSLFSIFVLSFSVFLFLCLPPLLSLPPPSSHFILEQNTRRNHHNSRGPQILPRVAGVGSWHIYR